MKFWLGWAAALAVMIAVLIFGYSQWNLRYYQGYIGDRAQLLAELRRGTLQEYFATAQAELRFWSRNEGIVNSQIQLNTLWDDEGEGFDQRLRALYIYDNPHPAGFLLNLDDPGDGSDYSDLHARTHPVARQFVTHRGYYDFFLIGPEGDIYYTVEKEDDFATNLVDGPWADTGLGEVFTIARNGAASQVIAVSDMRRYGPSADAPAIFIATAIVSPGEEFLGVMALQLPTDHILSIMNYTDGMGDSGETYVVGEDLLMRSNSRFSEESTVLLQTVDSPSVARALAGEQGRMVIDDYRGIPVMSGFAPLSIGRHSWAVIAEFDMAEIAEFAASERPALAGPLLLIYALSLWSVWYWRGRKLPEELDDAPEIELGDYPEGGGGA